MEYNSLQQAEASAKAWLIERQTPVCWITGPIGTQKTSIAHSLSSAANAALFLPLSATSPDRCLQQILGAKTIAGLKRYLTESPAKLLILDAFENVQYQNPASQGEIADQRFQYLLSSISTGHWPKLTVLITSRLPPPPKFNNNTIKLIELPALPDKGPLSGMDASDMKVLTVLASSRKASSGWLLGILTGLQPAVLDLSTPQIIDKTLKKALKEGYIHQIDIGNSADWFQMPDAIRKSILVQAHVEELHSSMAERLLSSDMSQYVSQVKLQDPELHHDLLERAVEHKIDARDITGAILCYWNELGNFARLSGENAIHFGARICYLLNNSCSPQEIHPDLQKAEGGSAILSDWGLYALFMGHSPLSTQASLGAFSLLPKDRSPLDISTAAHNIGEAMVLAGRFHDAMTWATEARKQATVQLRLQEGIPTQETMSAYDQVFLLFFTIARVYNNAQWAAQVLDELESINAIGIKQLAEFNRFSVIPIGGPTTVDRDSLLNGRAAATVAILSGATDDAIRILQSRIAAFGEYASTSYLGNTLQLLLLYAFAAKASFYETPKLIASIREFAANIDNIALLCELAVIEADIALKKNLAQEVLAITEEYLQLSYLGGLKHFQNELLQRRSKALDSLGRHIEAQLVAEQLNDLGPAPDFEQPLQQLQPGKDNETKRSGADRRMQLHEKAVQVIEDFNAKGSPFAIYFRKFDITVTHGPLEFGPELIENKLFDRMPPGTGLITIQSHDDIGTEYSGMDIFSDRNAPSLLLDDGNWKQVVTELIPKADLIVSECYFLSDGVRFELEQAYQSDSWDRTILILPPQKGLFPLIDNDPLVQMFPRCIWADALHNQPLAVANEMSDLLQRMAKIAALPEQERIPLKDRGAKNKAFPIDLLPIAEYYEITATLTSQWQDEDDRVRYYGFWQLFRAAAIRFVLLQRGDTSFTNRGHISSAFAQMSAIMFDHDREGDKLILFGDLTFAEQCTITAFNIILDSDGASGAYYREQAQKRYDEVQALKQALKADPEKFELRPRYGPIITHKGDVKI